MVLEGAMIAETAQVVPFQNTRNIPLSRTAGEREAR
jgi:hypothetical protein